MSAHTTHHLVDAYLRDLELLLRGLDPGDREEVLAGVREHLDGRLGAPPTQDEVRAALAELGPPQAIADEAYSGRPTAPAQPTPASTPSWHAVTATVVNAVGLLLGGLLLLAGPHPAEFVFIGTTFALPWLLALVLSAMSPAWQTREKAASILFFPALLVVLAVVTAILRPAIGPGTPANAALMVFVVLAGGWALVRLLRKTQRKDLR